MIYTTNRTIACIYGLAVSKHKERKSDQISKGNADINWAVFKCT